MLYLFTLLNLHRKVDTDDLPLFEIYAPCKNKDHIFDQHPEHISLKQDNDFRTMYRKADFERAKANIAKYEWASTRNRSIVSTAQKKVNLFTDQYIEDMIPVITPGTTTICPNCVSKGYHWHSNGAWSWNENSPNTIKCNVCGMVFPNEEYKESISYKSRWNETQVITYVPMKEQKCMSYQGCKSSIAGVIRNNKLNNIISSLTNIGLAYQFTGNTIFSNTLKKVFFRMASVFPSYLVYAGYSYAEYVDCDPRYAALNLKNLSADPSKNCRLIKATGYEENPVNLYSPYWSSSRIGSSGMDGSSVVSISVAYDLIRETLTKSEQKYIEKNVIEELSILFVGDDLINNKAVGNRQGAAFAGLAMANSELSRFGLNGFIRTMDEWWLKDCGTPESAAYAFMTLSGIYQFGYGFRNYSDSPDPEEGQPSYVNFNVNTDTRFDQTFQNLVWTSYGNLYYPSIADSYTTTNLSTTLAEFMNFAFPIEKEYIASRLKTITTPGIDGLFFRDPDAENWTTTPFTHPDIVFPFLSQGFIRTGEYGEKSLAVLDASNYGNHHHTDSLNLVYWKEGRELLMDLGYLWDHANASKTHSTKVHNTVIVNEEDQITKLRNGSISTFFTSKNIKIIQAASDAYSSCDVYNRTLVQIEHKDNSSYLVDIFRVHGGISRQYVFHGVNHNYTLNSDLVFNQTPTYPSVHFCIRIHISDLGYIEIKDPVLTVGSSTENILDPIPTEYHNYTSCPTNIGYGLYVGNGNGSLITNGTLKLEALSKDPKKNNVNLALNLGDADGYRAPRGLYGNLSNEYTLKWKMRGTVNPDVSIQYWKDDKVNDTNARTYNKPSKSDIKKVTEEWKDCSCTITLGFSAGEKKFGITNDKWNAVWKIDENYTFATRFPKRGRQKVFYEEGWGQRDYKNKDFGVTLPYFYIDGSDDENNYSTFVAVYEGHDADASDTVLDVETMDKGNGKIGVKINTKDGVDYVFASSENEVLDAYNRITDATVAVEVCDDEDSKVMIGGTIYNSITLEYGEFNGHTKRFVNEESNSYYVIETDMSMDELRGQNIQVKGEDNITRTYPIFHVEKNNNIMKIFTRYNRRGFRLDENVEWRVQKVVNIKYQEEETTNSVKKTSKNSKMSNGAIAGVIIASIVIIGALGFAVFVLIKRKHLYSDLKTDIVHF